MEKRRPGWRAVLAAIELHALETVLLVLVVLNAANIVARYVLHRPIGATFELMILLAIATYWIGAGTAERYSGHLGTAFVVSRLPANLRRATEVLRRIVVCAFLAAAAYAGTRLAMSQLESGAVSGALGLPLWPFVATIPLGALVMLVRVVRPPRRPAAEQGERQLL